MEDAETKEDPKVDKTASKLFEQKLNYTTIEIENIRKEFDANLKLIESLRLQKSDWEDQKFHIQKENKVLNTELEIIKSKLNQISKEISSYWVHKLKSVVLHDNGMLKKCNVETCPEKQTKDGRIKEQFEKVNQKIFEIKIENQKLMTFNSNLKDQISKLTTEKDTVELQIEQYKSNFKKMQDKLEKSTEATVFREAEVQELNKRITQLTHQNQQYQTEIEQMKKIIEANKEREQQEYTLLELKEQFLNEKIRFEAGKQHAYEKLNYIKLRLDEYQQLHSEQVEQNAKLKCDNLELKQKFEDLKTNETKVEEELVQLLSKPTITNIDIFSDYQSDLHPGVKRLSLSHSIKSLSDLQSEIFELKMLLSTERDEKESLEELCKCLKAQIVKNENDKQLMIEKHCNERKKIFMSKTQHYCHKEFINLFKEHMDLWPKREDCWSYDYLSKIILSEDEELVKKFTNTIHIKDKKDALASFPKLVKEKDQKIWDLTDQNQTLQDKIDKLEQALGDSKSGDLDKPKSIKFEEAVNSIFANEASESPSVDQYIESICNNKKLAREIRETLQILLMKEKNEIDHIKGLTDKSPREIDIDQYQQLEKANQQISFLEGQIDNINKLKVLVEEQLFDEYQINDELRKENRDLSDELIMSKESLSKLQIENYELKTTQTQLKTVKQWLIEINKKALQISINSIKGKASLHQTIEKTIKSIIGNVINSSEILKEDRKEYVDLINQLNSEKLQLELQNQQLMDIDKDTQFNIKLENVQLLYQKACSDLTYFGTFVNKIKSIIYNAEISTFGKPDISTLDTIYANFVELLKSKNSTKSQSNSESDLEIENKKLREMLEYYCDKYTKVIDRKETFIKNLQNLIETMLKSNNNPTESAAYKKLKEAKEQELKTVESEMLKLKKTITDFELSKLKHTEELTKLQTEYTTCMANLKSLGGVKDENDALKNKIKELEANSEKIKESLQKKYNEINQQLTIQITELKQANEQMKLDVEKSKINEPKKPDNTVKNLIKAFNLLRKAKRIIEYKDLQQNNTPNVNETMHEEGPEQNDEKSAQVAQPVSALLLQSEIPKPPSSVIKRKRDNKDIEKSQDEQSVEQEESNKMQKTDEN